MARGALPEAGCRRIAIMIVDTVVVFAVVAYRLLEVELDLYPSADQTARLVPFEPAGRNDETKFQGELLKCRQN